MSPPFYRTSFSRALFKYANNAFLAPYLDADDIAYIENIRERGCISCGSLADPTPTPVVESHYGQSVLLQELDYWQTRYGFEPAVERVLGTKRIAELVAEKELGKEKYEQIRRTRAARREADKAALQAEQQIAQEEWAREQAVLAKEREANLKRMIRADLEWEQGWEKIEHRRANNYPAFLRDGRFRYGFDPAEHRARRHYVPKWKHEEQNVREWASAAEQPEHSWESLKPPPVAKAMPPTPAPPRGAFVQPRPVLESPLKQTLREIFVEPRQWSIAELMGVTGCGDREMMLRCCIELGHDFKTDPPPTFTQAEIDKILDDAMQNRDREKLKAQLRVILAPKRVPKKWSLAELMELTETNDEALMNQCCIELIREGKALAS